MKICDITLNESDGGHMDDKDIDRVFHYVNQITDPEVRGLLRFILVKPFPLTQVIKSYRDENDKTTIR